MSSNMEDTSANRAHETLMVTPDAAPGIRMTSPRGSKTTSRVAVLVSPSLLLGLDVFVVLSRGGKGLCLSEGFDRSNEGAISYTVKQSAAIVCRKTEVQGADKTTSKHCLCHASLAAGTSSTRRHGAQAKTSRRSPCREQRPLQHEDRIWALLRRKRDQDAQQASSSCEKHLDL